MKRLVSLLALIFMLAGIFVGCDYLPIPDEDTPKVESPEETPNETPEEKPGESPETPEENPSDEPIETPEDNPQEPTLPPVGTAVGNRFKDLTLTTLGGEKVNTADLRGKIIIFNVWATWCPPCIGELPDFNEVASEYADDVVIIAVHTYDTGMYDMPSYVQSNFPDTKIIFAYDTPSSAAYIAAGGTRYVPQTAIIDRDGVIIYSASGALSHSWLVSFIENNNKE